MSVPITYEQAFLAAIIEAPQNDLPRLQFADWLEERGELGDLARAEFIRVQCELHDEPQVLSPGTIVRTESGQDGLLMHYIENPRRKWLEGREGELLTAVNALGWGPKEFAKARQRTLTFSGSNGPLKEMSPRGYSIQFQRGFVSQLACPMDVWLMHGPAIVRGQPIEVVKVTDREPKQSAEPRRDWFWHKIRRTTESQQSYIEDDLFEWLAPSDVYIPQEMMRRYSFKVIATQVLSDACIDWAKATHPSPSNSNDGLAGVRTSPCGNRGRR